MVTVAELFILIFILNLNSKLIVGETISDVENLLRDKFHPAVYNKQIRGQTDHTETMNVSLKFELKFILKLDNLQETLQLLGLLNLKWIDERLIWDPEAYNGTNKVYVPADKVWRPEIVVANPSSTVRFLGDDISRLVLQYHYSGLAEWTIGDMFECSCSVDLTSFPWDEQNCTIVFVAWAYNKDEIQLVAKQLNMEGGRLETNGQWIVLSTRTYTISEPFKSLLGYEIVIKRRATFFIVNILLPIITLSVLNLIVFIIPVESGERIAFSLTVLLSIGVFITLISENLPPSAETMASICYLLLFVLIKSAIICLLNIVTLKFYFKAEDPEPNTYWNKCFLLCDKIGFCSRSKHIVDKKQTSEESLDPEVETDTKSFEHDASKEKSVSWKDISKMFDRVFLVIMIFLLIFSYSVFIYHVSL